MGYLWNEKIETAGIEEMRSLQSQRLCSMVKRVYEHVPFYKKSMDECGVSPDDIKSVDDLEKLPFTKKQICGTIILMAFLPSHWKKWRVYTPQAGQQENKRLLDIQMLIWIFGENVRRAPLRRREERGKISFMFLMDTDCLPAGLDCMQAGRK